MTEYRDPLSESFPGPMSDVQLDRSAELLRRARAGDGAALGDLLERHRERLKRMVRIRLGPGLRAHLEESDILQETFAAIAAAPARLAGDEADFAHWLARIAVNRIRDAHDHWTTRKRGGAGAVPLDPAASEDQRAAGRLAASTTSPSEQASRAELREIVDAATAELPDDYREAILMRDYCGLPWETIAAELGRPTVHAAQQLHQRAWIKLRKRVEPRLKGL